MECKGSSIAVADPVVAFGLRPRQWRGLGLSKLWGEPLARDPVVVEVVEEYRLTPQLICFLGK
jgi:hypothetical protein